ncbi:MurR/RpiR family transcriptional regulator [Glycomyces sp. TRM65418]|uniref:MurR/RpiR family transcriptional regulator n=1 Tax=Glycomyces sp. TRM65418 TaxID=2867006 RepID=UPI001CE63D38|nr:MurR/RpiR family transcriptional regulator [Glycomyces sp. TRM65418]MCC3765658.1 MurR/RpiR family transcriptional regulator [Glycomyces sp. TRM65418]QZD55255.1 MurR/RpiR family transcriptional regulator [Glycomyces sp. TRM65418]
MDRTRPVLGAQSSPRPTDAANAPAKAGVLERIRMGASELSEAMSKVADQVLVDPEAAARATIMDLAELSGTSPGTITRFCRHLGYDGYAALRVAIATETGRASARRETGWDVNIGREIAHSDPLDRVLKQLITIDAAMLRDTVDTLDLDAVEQVAARVSEARRVDVYGVGSSAIVARELHMGFYRTGIAAWAWTEVHDALASAALLGEGDVAIAASLSGTTAEVVEMLTEAGSRGALTVAITGVADSPIAEIVDHCLVSAATRTGNRADLLAGRHSQLLVADLVHIAVAQRRFPEARDALESRAQAVAGHRPTPQPRNGSS